MTRQAIDLDNRQYQPLEPYTALRVGVRKTPSVLAANQAAKESVEKILEISGFRYLSCAGLSGWYRDNLMALIVSDNDGSNTIGVRICRALLAEYATHQMDGTYDALPLAEKHRLSGAGGTIDSWLSLFDRCGKSRPNAGVS